MSTSCGDNGPPPVSKTPVPLTVWLTDPFAGCCTSCEIPGDAACADRIPPGLAHRIIDAFSATGDLVFLPDPGNGILLTAAARAGRGAVALSTKGLSTKALSAEALSAEAHLHLTSTPAPAHLRRTVPHARARLAVAAPHTPATPHHAAALIAACARALHPRGVLVLCSRQSGAPDAAGHLIAHAQACGLAYLQHIVAVEAVATGSALAPRRPRTVDHAPGCACPLSRVRAGRHALIHTDLLVLTKP
ncbi:hypothetical protein [Kitasatospora viridis]|uniref:Uncharacterized protein n=1 Tax=Kitasatospora viridis TaxID=281105 RepID=A0A561TW62_9ACTN|nr:hypothetical protein [Kitasatospora viridis]TWF91342.1 hypothetical protein FHX73_12454 [Kitasatospora viridis]